MVQLVDTKRCGGAANEVERTQELSNQPHSHNASLVTQANRDITREAIGHYLQAVTSVAHAVNGHAQEEDVIVFYR